ncbi:MAG TPA: VOC family protein [Acidimicrobiales bacterium]|nr:VOC family protein [Acidimicrobiales bacterium]
MPVRDLTVAREFYVGVLGLSVLDENPAAVAVESAGTTLRLTAVGELQPQPFTIAGWEVPDVHEAVASLTDAGVTFTLYDELDQDDQGIWTSPGGDLVAWFMDPDGNTLSLTEGVRT